MKQEKTMFGYTPEQYKRFKQGAWMFLLMFSLLYCSIYCTRTNLAAAGAKLIEELNWNAKNIGLITGVLFWTYGLGQLVSGRLAEMMGANRFIILAVLLSSAVNVAVGFSESVWLTAVLWGLNGLFQSMAWAPGVACLMKWWPGKTHGFAVGFANAFSGFGGAVASLAVVASFKLFPGFGWRAAFFLPAAIPLLMLVLYLILSKAAPEKIGIPSFVEEDPEKAEREEKMNALVREKGALYPFKYVLANRMFAVWLIIAFITGVTRYGLTTWVPMYFSERFGLDVTEGLLQSLLLPVGMGFGTLIMPMISDKIWRNNRILHVIFSSLVCAIAIGAFFFLDPRVPAQMVVIEVLLFVAGFFVYAITGIGGTYAVDLGGRVFAGTSSGIFNFACYMGSAVQAVVYGFLKEQFGWSVIFVSMAVFCFVVTVLSSLAAAFFVKKKQ